MARIKKEKAEETQEKQEQTEVASVATEPKKTKTSRAKKAVTVEQNQEKSARKTRKGKEKNVESAEEKKAVELAQEKAEIIQEKKETIKAKRGRKPAIKKQENKAETEKTVEVSPVEVKEEKKEKAKKTLTRAEKNTALREIVKGLLSVRPYKWSELLEESGKLYQEKTDDADAQNANDLRGRIGSVVDVMKKDGEVSVDGGVYALNASETAKQPVEEKPESVKTEQMQAQTEEKKDEKNLPVVKEPAKLTPVFDMSVLLGKKDENKGGRVENKPVETPQDEKKTEETKSEQNQEKPAQKKTLATKKTEEKKDEKKISSRKTQKNAEESLKEAFLKKIRSLGGAYFEYFSVYLLERYSLRNGRRVDGMRISGGEYDGGIDGEIEVTDAIGFKETIYIQAKNWNPMSGKDEGWIVGETHLQQFIGAVCYRQAKEGKQHSRGIFVTTSYFSSGAKEMLRQMSDKFVGYDGDDLFETAKECSFGLVQKDGRWVLDEKLLSGDKAFFNMY